jgi:oxysterol-binding protein-related protein 9/10/11
LKQRDFITVVTEKGKIEEAQRAMRRLEKKKGEKWETEYFRQVEVDGNLEALSGLTKGVDIERLVGSTGVWRFDFGRERERRRRGYRGRGGREGRTPLG